MIPIKHHTLLKEVKKEQNPLSLSFFLADVKQDYLCLLLALT
jgi:hypothetical protein